MTQSALMLARIQFGVTLMYHFWFVALTLGLSILIALMESVYVRTGSNAYRTLSKYWGSLFLVNYAVGVVTGLVNEFQFGMNWAGYSRFVGAVFGPPLAFEALTAFFIGSVSIGVWVYGWDKVSRRVHLAAIWLVALSANYSAFWILAANAFMQHPVGYTLVKGRAELADLTALITNSYLYYQYSHTVLSGLVTAGFFMMAVSAYSLTRGMNPDLFGISFRLGGWCTFIAIVAVIATGHFYNQYLAQVQPMKLAASEAVWQTSGSTPLIAVAMIDEVNRQNTLEVTLPGWLSLLTYNTLDTPVRGMVDLQTEYSARFGPGDYIPAVKAMFWSFRVMVLAGFWLAALTAVSLWRCWKSDLTASPLLLKAIVWSLPLPYLAVAGGWLVAELGRQPWSIYGLLLTEHGVSKFVNAASVWTSLAGYTAIYTLVAAAALYIARKIILAGPGD